MIRQTNARVISGNSWFSLAVARIALFSAGYGLFVFCQSRGI